jgi:hypothetical protein
MIKSTKMASSQGGGVHQQAECRHAMQPNMDAISNHVWQAIITTQTYWGMGVSPAIIVHGCQAEKWKELQSFSASSEFPKRGVSLTV